MRERALAVLGLIALVAACGDTAERPATTTFDTLPGGAVVARNGRAGAWDSAATWRFVELTRIGAIEGDGPDVFGDVRDIEVDALGRVWVLDAQQKRVEVFERDGRHVRTVGRPGSGPGEFEYPIGLELDPLGRVWVLDPRNTRYSVFDSAGVLVASHRRESTYTPWVWEGGISDDGRVYDTSVIYEAAPPGRDVLIERDTAGAVRDTIELPRFEQAVYEVRVNGTLMQTVSVPFTPRLDWELADDGTFWSGVSDDYRLVQQSIAGDTLRIIEKEWTPVAVPAEERDAWLAQDWVEDLRRQGADIDPGRVPAHKPAWGGFWLDDRGYVWVVATPPADTAQDSVAFDIFDPEGRYLGAVSLGSRRASRPLIRGADVYFVEYGEMDEPNVIIGRLEGRD
ncbi:MAG TPA: 6-bladed beta-propeller [Longimicrobiales bacterium]